MANHGSSDYRGNFREVADIGAGGDGVIRVYDATYNHRAANGCGGGVFNNTGYETVPVTGHGGGGGACIGTTTTIPLA